MVICVRLGCKMTSGVSVNLWCKYALLAPLMISNIRELKNLVQRLLILGNRSHIEVSEIEMMLKTTNQKPSHSALSDFDIPLREARENFEKNYIEHQMCKYNYSVSQVSARIGIERTHLYRKLRALGIDPKQLKENKLS